MGMKMPLRLHQEDFAQAMGITSSEKYESSAYELEVKGYGAAIEIQKEILKKAGIHNFKLTNS